MALLQVALEKNGNPVLRGKPKKGNFYVKVNKQYILYGRIFIKHKNYENRTKNISIKELSKDYSDDGEGGVKGYGGKLDIRPPFQREFVYGDKERNKVIDTVSKGFPLNVMYWAVRKNGTFEIIDGQQRTISICQFINRTFSYKKKYFQIFKMTNNQKY